MHVLIACRDGRIVTGKPFVACDRHGIKTCGGGAASARVVDAWAIRFDDADIPLTPQSARSRSASHFVFRVGLSPFPPFGLGFYSRELIIRRPLFCATHCGSMLRIASILWGAGLGTFEGQI